MPAPVIVVHDGIGTRALALEALRAAGLEAIGFSSPMEALDAIEADSRVRVLVTRINFGEGKLNGLALGRMLLTKRLGVKTVFVDHAGYEHFAADIGEFLASPLNPHHLVDVVARLLCSEDNARAELFKLAEEYESRAAVLPGDDNN
jgi:DNA-binding NtrC family response regulator